MDGIDLRELLINAEVVGNIVGAMLGFFLGVVAAIFTQRKLEKQETSQITYSTKVIVPLEIALAELEGKLRVFYEDQQIDVLFFSSLELVNSGNLTIRDQAFTCQFPENTRLIDQAFPRITTVPNREVGPVNRDNSFVSENEFRFIIDTLGVGQSVKIEFLTIKNESTSFTVHFRPNHHKEVDYVEGEISTSPTLESHVRTFIMAIAFYILIIQMSSALPFIGRFFGIAFGIPFLLQAIRTLPNLIPTIVRRLNMKQSQSTTTHFHEQVGGRFTQVVGK